MGDLLHSQKEEENARESLLRYYSSLGIAHGTYTLTVAIAIFAFLEIFPSIIFPNETLHACMKVLTFSFILSVFLTIGSYVIGRTFFWGYLTTPVLWVRPMNNKDVAEKHLKSVMEKANITLLVKLHLACVEYVKDKHAIWSKFSGLDYRFLSFLLVVCFLFSWIILFPLFY